MDKKIITLHILPHDVDPETVEGYRADRIGKSKSTAITLLFNKTIVGYSILFDDDVFCKLSSSTFISGIMKVIKTNIPNDNVNIGIEYHWRFKDRSLAITNPNELYNEEVGQTVIAFHALMTSATKDEIQYQYFTTKSIREIAAKMTSNDEDTEAINTYTKTANKIKPYAEMHNENIPNNIHSDMIQPKQVQYEQALSFIDDMLGTGDGYYDDDDEEYDDKKKKRKKSHSYDSSDINPSRIIKAAKKPKKDYKRHGIIVCTNKSAVDKDEKVIKEFLKSFIPGDSGWKKDFRKDVLHRWMQSYAISKKRLKKFEKNAAEEKKRKKRMINATNIIGTTSRIMTTPVDHWYDPNK